MSKKLTTLVSTLLGRSRSFLQDFLLANNLQLLFPLASLVLYVGASYPWLPPRHVLSNLQYQHQDGTLWFDISTRFLMLRYYAILYAVHFGFLGSLALWCLPVRNLWGKFTAWVLLPGGLAVTWFTAIVLVSRPQPSSVLELPGQVPRDDLRPILGRLFQLGTGFYITILGMALFAVALRVAAVRGVPLPIRFRKSASRPQGSAREETVVPRLFVLVVVTAVVAALIQIGILVPMVPVPGAPLPRYDTWPHSFPAWHWLPDLLEGLVVAACAILLFRSGGQPRTSQRKRSIRSFIPVAVLVPLSISVVPRLILKALVTFSTLLSNVPYEILGFGAFPWVLIVFVIAALQEFTLRACLQNRLENRFGFKRACLLIGLLWWLLPLSSGFGPIPGLRIAVPGLSVLVNLLALILYNVPLAWLWSRTRSLWLVSFMHGTMLLFRAGDSAYTVYYTFRWLYWVETAAWIFITVCLFKKFPIIQSDASPAPASD
jgi:membrane protease YdiL (CAAX protease family)